MLKQVCLKRPLESLQIPYPKNFAGERSTDSDEVEMFVGTEPRFVTEDEIPFLQAFVEKLPYRQELVLTGATLTNHDDPLFSATHEHLDRLEAEVGIGNSRFAGGGERSVRERVYILREAGVVGNGNKALPPVIDAPTTPTEVEYVGEIDSNNNSEESY